MNVHEDWIYFVNENDDDTVYRMKTDGSEMKQLSTLDSVRSLLYHDGYLYFVPNTDYYVLYRMKSDGSDLTVINEDWIEFFIIFDNKLYVSQLGEDGIFRSDLDGTGKIKLTDYYSDFFNITNGYIFYNNTEENSQQAHLYRMKLDGSNNTLWLDQAVGYMCVNDGYLYFYNEKDEEPHVYRMYYDNKELELVDLPYYIE
jgi:hypothetical protein